MKKFFSSFISFFLLFVLSSVQSANAVSSVVNVDAGKGMTLWGIWHHERLLQTSYSSFEEFKAKFAEYNNIPNEEKAFRNLKPGVWLVPAPKTILIKDEGDTLADSDFYKLRETRNGQLIYQKAEPPFPTTNALNKEDSLISSVFSLPKDQGVRDMFYIILGLVFLLVFTIWRQISARSKLEKEKDAVIGSLREEIVAMNEAVLSFKLPSDLKHPTGRKVIYLPKMWGSDDSVEVNGQAIKLQNLAKHLRRNEATRKFLGLIYEEKSEREEDNIVPLAPLSSHY